MAKRGASNDLNHDNWDRDDEPEESGTFEKAPVDVIKKRTIKVAKRRNPISTQNDEGKPNIFGGFTAFSKSAPSSNSTNSTFGFLSNLTPKKNDDSEKQTNGTPTNEQKSSDEYYAKLKGLNESVSAWIRQHVTENPLINLQPVFKDYDRYFAELEKLKNSTVSPPTTTTTIPQFNFSTTSSSSTTAPTTVPKFSFAPSVPSKFTFGAPPATTPSAATFSFGSKPSSTLDSTVTASFSTSSGNTTNLSSLSTTLTSDLTTKPLNFGSTPFANPVASQTTTTTTTNDKKSDNNENNDESDDPPKVEFIPVVEKDHIYSVRCKLFVKKDGNFGDRGVGTLYLKTIPNNEKLQLIVRADTNLGNLLCNFILSESIPMQRMGKKDVMLVCLPTPEHQPPPVPILLRVKSPEEADELLKTLEKHKK